MKIKNYRWQQGFTLTEVMVVVVIVAVLASIAYPSYQNSVLKGKRQVGKTAIQEVLGRQEQYFVNTKSYATDLTDLGYPANGFYVDTGGDAMASCGTNCIYLVQLSSPTTSSFTVQAVPQGSQTDDTDCGTLSMTDSGSQSPASCWN